MAGKAAQLLCEWASLELLTMGLLALQNQMDELSTSFSEQFGFQYVDGHPTGAQLVITLVCNLGSGNFSADS